MYGRGKWKMRLVPSGKERTAMHGTRLYRWQASLPGRAKIRELFLVQVKKERQCTEPSCSQPACMEEPKFLYCCYSRGHRVLEWGE